MLGKAVDLLGVCKQVYGLSTHYGEVAISMSSQSTSLKGYVEIYGDLCCINIVEKNIESEDDLVQTVIHEYQHSLQGTTEDFEYFFNMGHDYESHPFELEAEKVALRDYDLIKSKLPKLKEV